MVPVQAIRVGAGSEAAQGSTAEYVHVVAYKDGAVASPCQWASTGYIVTIVSGSFSSRNSHRRGRPSPCIKVEKGHIVEAFAIMATSEDNECGPSLHCGMTEPRMALHLERDPSSPDRGRCRSYDTFPAQK